MNCYPPHPSAAVNAKQGERLLARMRQRWPAAFGTAKPLKLGIRGDLIAARVCLQDVDHFLSWYVQTPEYLQAQAQPGAQRHDLKGTTVGPVSDENRSYAAQEHSYRKHRAFVRTLIGDGRG